MQSIDELPVQPAARVRATEAGNCHSVMIILVLVVLLCVLVLAGKAMSETASWPH